MRPLRATIAAIVFLLPGLAAANGPVKKTGNLYYLGVAMDQKGEKGGWARVGDAGAWKLTHGGAILNGHLYTAESDGSLRSADLTTGERKQIGKLEFGNTVVMFASGEMLFTIETDGSLFRVNPGDGTWARVGPEGAFKRLRAGAIFNGRLYTAESDGSLRSADLTTGERKQVGKLDFGNTAGMYASADKLYTIETNGNLFRVDPSNGTWAQVGLSGAYKLARAGAIFNDRLYTAESDGTLRWTNLKTGVKKLIGNPDFGATVLMCTGGDQIYTLETDGSLYRVYVKTAEGVNECDGFAQAIEGLLRDQAKDFHNQFNTRLVMGNKATHAGIMDGLAWLRQKTAKDDLVVFYMTAHGFADPDEGWGVAAVGGQVFWGHELKAELGKLPCPVIVILSTCESGGFGLSHKKDPPVPPNVTALCACAEKQTTNTEIDISVTEALYGRADYNQDGVVDRDELIRYIQERYKGWQPDPKKGDGGLTPVLVTSKALPGPMPLTKVKPDLAAVAYQGVLWSAVVGQPTGDTYPIQILGWNPTPGRLYFLTDKAPRDALCLASDGLPVLVEVNGQWLPACIQGQDHDNYKVHYLAKAHDDETVTKDRIKYVYAARLDP